MIVKLLVEGGSMSPGPALAQQLGPMGINMGQVISDINKATESFKGTKVPVELNVDPSTKEFTINVRSPPVSELLKKELNLEKGAGDHKKEKVGNIAIEQIISIAKAKLPENLENNLKNMVKTVNGTCVSLGILVESKEAIETAKDIENDIYEKEINAESTEASEEKLKSLKEFFSGIQSDQEAKKKQEEAEKAAEEEAKEEAKEDTETTEDTESSDEKKDEKAK